MKITTATHCVNCGKELTHAESIERGMGPECSAEGYPMEAETPELLREVQGLIRKAAIASQSGNLTETIRLADEVTFLGFDIVGEKIKKRHVKLLGTAERTARITISAVGETLVVRTPFRRSDKQAFVQAWREIPGRRYSNGANIVPAASKPQLWALLRKFFAGQYGMAPDGTPFRIPAH